MNIPSIVSLKVGFCLLLCSVLVSCSVADTDPVAEIIENIRLIDNGDEMAYLVIGEDSVEVQLVTYPYDESEEYRLWKDSLYREREAKIQRQMASSNCRYIKCDTTVNGYEVNIEVHLDSDDYLSGWAKYYFSSPEKSFSLISRFEAPITGLPALDHIDPRFSELRFPTEATRNFLLEVPEDLSFPNVTDLDSLEMSQYSFPFTFMDVDFDGEQEILFHEGGFNSYYCVPFKVIGNTAEIMTGRPYNNLVSGGYMDCVMSDDSEQSTLDKFLKTHIIRDKNKDVWADRTSHTYFDSVSKTIKISESMGYDYRAVSLYKRKDKVTDPLDPMTEVEYSDYLYKGNGSIYVSRQTNDRRGDWWCISDHCIAGVKWVHINEVYYLDTKNESWRLKKIIISDYNNRVLKEISLE